ncbi:Hypothetical protein SCF082_LOCUS33591 [Durusdinium trenchii]|uniref:G domain-containing protein n=1 Tax=Durusdinium trenchii TaxID=1381693 RepID=A0ABP0NPP3_9DINO
MGLKAVAAAKAASAAAKQAAAQAIAMAQNTNLAALQAEQAQANLEKYVYGVPVEAARGPCEFKGRINSWNAIWPKSLDWTHFQHLRRKGAFFLTGPPPLQQRLAAAFGKEVTATTLAPQREGQPLRDSSLCAKQHGLGKLNRNAGPALSCDVLSFSQRRLDSEGAECIPSASSQPADSTRLMECLAGAAALQAQAQSCLCSGLSTWAHMQANKTIGCACDKALEKLKECIYGHHGCELGRAAEASLEEILRGEPIRAEFQDTQLNLEEAVEECTIKAKELVKSSPIFFFGCTGHGKSRLINSLLQSLGSSARCEEGDGGRCTRRVQGYEVFVESWSMHGFRERVLLFDTPGWQLGSEAQAAPELLQQCLGEAERMGVPPEMLQERLVLVLVHQAEWIERDVENPSFRELVGGLVRAAAARCTQQPVLVPVLTKKIKAVAVQAFSMNLEAWKKELQGGSQLEVYKAVCSSSGDASTRGAAVRHLQTLLAQASAKSSGKIRETVTELIEEQLRKRLQSWGRLGDSPHALARR